jgi:hypothetical protein
MYRKGPSMLTVLFRIAGWAVYQVVQEYKALEDLAVQLTIAADDDIGCDDPEDDVYAGTIGFSAEQGRLRKED